MQLLDLVIATEDFLRELLGSRPRLLALVRQDRALLVRRLQLRPQRFSRLALRLQLFLELTHGGLVFLDSLAHRNELVGSLLRHLFAGLRVQLRTGKLVAQLRDRSGAAFKIGSTRGQLRRGGE